MNEDLERYVKILFLGTIPEYVWKTKENHKIFQSY